MKLNTIDLAELEDLIEQAEAKTALAVRRVMKKVRYDVLTAGQTQQMVAAGPGDTSSDGHSTPPFGALNNIYKYWLEALSELLSPLLSKAWNAGVGATITSVHDVTPEWDAPVVNDLALQKLASAENRVNNLATEMWQHAQAEIMAGVEAGDDIQQMAARVSAAADLSIPHARTVVRTEVISAANAGTFDLIELAGFTGKQEWLATNDPKTRLSHKKADGQRVEIGEMFTVGGYQAHYPGAETLPPGERVNCRCTVAYDVDEDDLVAALVAAGKWDAGKHPRDSKGRFVKKNLLGILSHKATDDEIKSVIAELDYNEWQNLTPTQKQTIADEVDLAGSSSAVETIKAFMKKDMVGGPTAPAKTTGSNVGPKIKVTHKDIHSPKKSGDILATSPDGKTTIIWNETQKKYVVLEPGGKSTLLPKSKVYDFMQGKEWHALGSGKSNDDDVPDEPSKMLDTNAPAPTPRAKKYPTAYDNAPKKVGKKVGKKVAKKTSPPIIVFPDVDIDKPLPPKEPDVDANSDHGGFTFDDDAIAETPEYMDWKSKLDNAYDRYEDGEVIAENHAGAQLVKKGLDIHLKAAGSDTSFVTTPSNMASLMQYDPTWQMKSSKTKPKSSEGTVGGKTSQQWNDHFTNTEFDGGDVIAENDVGAKIALHDNGVDLNLYNPDGSIQETQPVGDWASLMILGGDNIDSWKAVNPGEKQVKKKVFDTSTNPIDPDWDSIAEELETNGMEPGLIIAQSQDGYYIEVESDGHGVSLFDADGELVDATDGSSVETLTTKFGFAWEQVDVADADNMLTKSTPKIMVAGNDITDIANAEKAWESADGKTAVVQTSTGQMFIKEPGKPWTPSKLNESLLNNMKFKQVHGPASAPEPGADVPKMIKGLSIPSQVDGATVTDAWVNNHGILLKTSDGSYHNVIKSSYSNSIDVYKNSYVTDEKIAAGYSGYVKVTNATPNIAMAGDPSKHGADIPGVDQQKFKNAIKDAGLGYWSKPDKIWAVVKQIMAANPDPGNPGQSKYTGLQVLQALDSTLKTKTPNPYVDKVNKWAKTPAGSAAMKAMDASPPIYTPPVAKTAKKTASKIATPVNVTPVNVNGPGKGFDPEVLDYFGESDISGMSDATKKSIYDDFKKLPNTYLSSDESSILAAAKNVAISNKISVLQAIRVIDEIGAQKVNAANSQMFEKKVLAWAKTPIGAAKLTGKSPPTPGTPVLKFGNTVPPKSQTDHMKYSVVSYSKAEKLWADAQEKHGKITAAEKAGLRHYTGGSYTPMNAYLRGETTSITPQNAKAITDAQMGFRPSTEPMLLHRGVGWSAFGVNNVADLQKLVGKKGTHKGFSSTSIGGTSAFSGSVTMEIEAPPGTPMAFVDPFSLNKGENEMLLAAGLDFEILWVKPGGGKHGNPVARVRIIP